MLGRDIFLEVIYTPTSRERAQAQPKFGGSLLFMYTPFVAVLLNS